MTSKWFPHSKAYEKRAEIARLIREETGRLLLFNENQGRKRPCVEATEDQAKPLKIPKVQKTLDKVTVTKAVKKPSSVLVMTSDLDLKLLKVAELKAELSALGLPKSGNKGVLIARLRAYIAEGNPNPLRRKFDNLES